MSLVREIIAAVSFVLSSDPQPKLVLHQTCVSTQFGHKGDPWIGGKAHCTKRYIDEHRDVGLAHRWLPCGTRVRIRHLKTGKAITATVMDRGPYGALDEDGNWFVKTDRGAPGTYRGCADLTPLVTKALGHRGFDRVQLTYVNPRLPAGMESLSLETLMLLQQARAHVVKAKKEMANQISL